MMQKSPEGREVEGDMLRRRYHGPLTTTANEKPLPLPSYQVHSYKIIMKLLFQARYQIKQSEPR